MDRHINWWSVFWFLLWLCVVAILIHGTHTALVTRSTIPLIREDLNMAQDEICGLKLRLAEMEKRLTPPDFGPERRKTH